MRRRGLTTPSRMRRASVRSAIRWAASSVSPPWSGWASRRRSRNWRCTSCAVRHRRAGSSASPSTPEAHCTGSRKAAVDQSRPRSRPDRWVMNTWSSGPDQRMPLRIVSITRGRAVERQLPGRVHRRQDVLGGGALLLELEGEVLALAHQAVDAAGEADAVLLEAVAEPRLRHAHALLELEGEAVQVVEEVGVELLDVAGDDAAQQQPAEAGRRGGRKVRPPERHPPGRRDRPRVEHLQLGQDHRLRLLDASDVRTQFGADGGGELHDVLRVGVRASRPGRPARRLAPRRRPTSPGRCRTGRWRRRRRGLPRRWRGWRPCRRGRC